MCGAFADQRTPCAHIQIIKKAVNTQKMPKAHMKILPMAAFSEDRK